jgi:hypothetical protein
MQLGKGDLIVFACCTPRAYVLLSMTVEEIKRAIPDLTLEERAEVARCLHEWEDDDWDRQMRADITAGKLENFILKVDRDIATGKLRDLP